MFFSGAFRAGEPIVTSELRCIATGTTLSITRKRMRQVIIAYLQAMREDGENIPEPSRVEVLEVA